MPKQWHVEVDQSGRMEMSGDIVVEEYIGYEAETKSLLLDRLRSFGVNLDANDITIARIGKKPPAHVAGIRVMRRQTSANKTPTVDEFLKYC